MTTHHFQEKEKPLWIEFAKKIDIMPRRKQIWPTYLIIHWTAGEPSQKGEDGIKSGKDNGYTYLFLERSGQLFQGAPTNSGGYHAGNAKISSTNALGVEVACAGNLQKINDLYVPWYAKNKDGSINTKRCIPKEEVVYDNDDTIDDGSFRGYYQAFTKEQKISLVKLSLYCVQVLEIKVENIQGHDEIALPHGRKVDPGLSICSNGMVGWRKYIAGLLSIGVDWKEI